MGLSVESVWKVLTTYIPFGAIFFQYFQDASKEMCSFQYASNKFLLGSSITKRFREEAAKIEGVKSLLIEDPARLDDAIKMVFDSLDGSETARKRFGRHLDLEEFTEIFLDRVRDSEGNIKDGQLEQLRDNAKQLFRLLDTDGSGTIDWMEVAAKTRGM